VVCAVSKSNNARPHLAGATACVSARPTADPALGMKLLFLLLSCMAVTIMAVASESDPQCEQYFNSVKVQLATRVFTTLESAFRGVLLGFGASILKDVLERKSKKGGEDDVPSYHKKMLQVW
jgi:hypothetical protein